MIYDTSVLRWEAEQSGSEIILRALPQEGDAVAELHFEDEDALNNWLTFSVPTAIRAMQHRRGGPEEAAKGVMRRIASRYGVDSHDISSFAEEAVEGLATAGLKVRTGEPPEAASGAETAVRTPGARPRNATARQCPDNTPHNGHYWHDSITAKDHNCEGLDGYVLRRGLMGTNTTLVNTEDELEKGRWTDREGRVWEFTRGGKDRKLKDKLGDVWHWAGGYGYAQGWPVPLLSRADWEVQDIPLTTIELGVGPLTWVLDD